MNDPDESSVHRSVKWTVVGCVILLSVGVALASVVFFPRSSLPARGVGLVLPLPAGFRYLGTHTSGGNGDPPADCPESVVTVSRTGPPPSTAGDLLTHLLGLGWREMIAGEHAFGVTPEVVWTLVRRAEPRGYVNAFEAQAYVRSDRARVGIDTTAFVERSLAEAGPGEVVMLLELIDEDYPACLGAQPDRDEMLRDLETLLERGASDREIDQFIRKKYGSK